MASSMVEIEPAINPSTDCRIICVGQPASQPVGDSGNACVYLPNYNGVILAACTVGLECHKRRRSVILQRLALNDMDEKA